MFKRTISLLLSILCIFSGFPIIVSAAADKTAAIYVEKTYAAIGTQVEVDVSIAGNPGIAGATFTVSYHEDLTLINAVSGPAFSELDYTAPGTYANPCNFTWDSENAEAAESGVFLTLTFLVAEGASANEKLNVDVSYRYGDVFDDDSNIVFSIVNGSVAVLDYIPGDVYEDGVINSKDTRLIRQHIAGGYDIMINEAAADVNDDGVINAKDTRLIRRYIAGGYDVVLLPSTPRCSHTMISNGANAATCTEPGNNAYWYCISCGKYFSDESATTEITLADTVIPATGHTYAAEWSFDQTYHWHASTCEHNNLVQDKAEHSYGNDNICDICSAANTPDPTKPYKITYELYEFNQNKGDNYLPTAYIDNAMNPSYYSDTDSFIIKNPTCAGYEFLGWFTADGTHVTQIQVGTNKDLILQARWNPIPYKIVYRLFKTPVEDNIKEEYKTYTVNKGLVDMPNPEIYNYIFLGWYTDDGVEVTNIPIGTTGDIALNAFFVSKRNLANPVNQLGDPIIIENTDDGVIYFAYELGTIENVPLATLETYENIVGLKQIVSKEYTWSVSNQRGEEITDTISKSTVDSGTWSWSENWSDVLQVSQEWAEEHGMTQTDAKEAIKTTTDGYSSTHSDSGTKGTNVTDGTTTLDYNSTNTKALESVELDINASIGYTAGANVGFAKAEYSVSVDAGVSKKNSTETDKHTGTDTTNVDTTVTANSSSWNDETTKEHSEQLSTSESVTNAFSEIISNTKGYGKSYAKGGEGSKSFDSSTSESSTSSASSTVTFTTAESKTTTTTIEIDADTMKEGSYRLTIGGTMHVFAVVGYDIANKSYFHYTYNVMDDSVKTFFDYSCDNSFSDHEYSVLPFEIPYFVHEYVSSRVAVTEGVAYKTDSTTGTATILQYNGESTDVLIPTYISAGGSAYKVTQLSANAFAGNTSIKTVILSEYIDEIPDGAFKGCTSLEEISGFYTKIGDEAFSGCGKLNSFSISSAVSEIGEKAFTGVKQISVIVLNADSAIAVAESRAALGTTENAIIADAQAMTQELVNAAVNSGADTVILDISNIISGTKLNIEIPEITYFELNGGKKTYTDLAMVSSAQTTKLSELIINNSSSYSLDIKSEDVLLNAVSVTSIGMSLALSCDGTRVSLYKDTRLTSSSATAIVCKNATFSSLTVDGVIGTLDVFGNIYVVGESGNVTENTCPYFVTVTNGEIVAIEEEQVDGFVKGIITITYNANSGTVKIPTATVIYGSVIEEMPIPEWKGYTFLGWFDANGIEVGAGDVIYYTEDTTLKARWKSGHVLESTVPDGAEIVPGSEFWTYDVTTNITSDKSSVDGYILYDTTSEWGEYGDWSEWSTTEVTASESREVETRSIWGYYSYTCTNCGYHNDSPNTQCVCGYYTEHSDFVSIWSTQAWTDSYKHTINGETWYEWTHENNGAERIQYRYRDRELIYTYYHTKTETMESATEVTKSDTISNINKYVQYVIQ